MLPTLMGNISHMTLPIAAVHINFVFALNDFYLTTSTFALRNNC